MPHTEVKLAIAKVVLHDDVGSEDRRFLNELNEGLLAAEKIGISQWQSLRLSRIVRELGIITPPWPMRRS